MASSKDINLRSRTPNRRASALRNRSRDYRCDMGAGVGLAEQDIGLPKISFDALFVA